jgi:hypothetical protein
VRGLSAAKPIRVRPRFRPRGFYDDQALLTDTEAWTWTEWQQVPWAFRPSSERRDAGWAATLSLAKLRAGRLHVKVRQEATVGGWAAGRDGHVRRYGDPGEGWAAHLAGAEARQLERQRWSKRVVAGWRLGVRGPVEQLRDQLPDYLLDGRELHGRALARWADAAAGARDTLGRGAFGAVGLSAVELRQVRQHAAFRGIDPPELSVSRRRLFEPDQVADEFCGLEVYPTVVPTRGGLRTCLRIVAPSGQVRYSAGWLVGTMPDSMLFPAGKPWLAHMDGLDFPCEQDAWLDLVPPRRALRDVKRKLEMARDQANDAAFAGIDLPLETEQMIALARKWEYAIPKRRLPVVYGWVGLRADADSAGELAARWDRAVEHYKEIGIDLEWPGGWSQVDLYLQGIPGGTRKFSSYKQRWPIETVGCGMVHAGSGLSHPVGMYAGTTTGRMRRQVVRWNPHHAITRSREHGERHVEGQGGAVLLGNQRAGKSNALGTMAHDHALGGIPTVMIDFGGMQARLAGVPDLAGRVQVIDLLAAGGGSADTMTDAVVPGSWADPRVAQARRKLTRDTLELLAWPEMRQPGAGSALRDAIRAVGGSAFPSTAKVIADLAGRGEVGAQLASLLAFDLDTADGALVTGERGGGDWQADVADERVPLTILTGGVQLPDPSKPVDAWDSTARFGAAMFGIAAWRARRLLWGLDPRLLRLLLIDEAHVALATAAGRKVIEDALRAGPKLGVATVLATHNAQAVADPAIANSVSTWFQFRSTSSDELADALRLARVEDTPRTRALIRGFRNGECLAVFPNDARDRFVWDRWNGPLREALNTTAGRLPEQGRELEAASA